MTALLAIDPGHAGEGCACAEYARGALICVWFERFSAHLGNGDTFETVVVERPAYQGQRSDQARVADLINLAWSEALLAGAYAGRDGAELVALTPNDVRDKACKRHGRRGVMRFSSPVDCTCSRGWKGSEQKPVHHRRLWDVLTPAEHDVLGGADTFRRIAAAAQKGALDRWGKPGASYYGSWTGHNLLDAAALGCYQLGRLERK